jgi:hypothetical protein
MKENGMSRSTEELRELWKIYGCAPEKMVVVPFGPDRIKVAPPTTDAWKALARVLRAINYLVRIEDMRDFPWSHRCQH